MKYDRKTTRDETGYVNSASISCAFNEVRDSFSLQFKYGGWNPLLGRANEGRFETQEELETRLWDTLCEALTAAETRPVLIPTKASEKEMVNLLSACPYVQLLAESKSRHGKYKVQLWFIPVHEKGE
jgi:hypothetical protein